MDSLLAAARACPLTAESVARFAAALSDSAGEVEDALSALARSREADAFSALLIAVLDAGVTIDARHLEPAVAYLPHIEFLAMAASRVHGDPARPLVSGALRPGEKPERASLALALAACWSRQRAEPFPPELTPEARRLARHAHHRTVIGDLTIVAAATADPELLLALGFDPSRMPPPPALPDTADRALAAHLPSERAAAVLSGFTVRRAVPRVGRNDPCHCGSGRKYKRCCAEADDARLRDSSEIAGVTRAELRQDPGRALTARRLYSMPVHDLVRIARAGSAPPELHAVLVSLLVRHEELEEIGRLCDTGISASPGVERPLSSALWLAAERGNAAVLRKLLSVTSQGEDARRLFPVTIPVLFGEVERGALDLMERAAAPGGDQLELAYDLLRVAPHVGIQVARGVLLEAQSLDAEMLLDALLEARARASLPLDDPIEDIVWRRLEGGGPRASRGERAPLTWTVDDDDGDTAHARVEIRRLREETAHLARDLDEARSALEKASAPARNPESASIAESPPPSTEVTELKQRVRQLRDELKQRHDERNALRRELRRVGTQAETARAPDKARGALGDGTTADAAGADYPKLEAHDEGLDPEAPSLVQAVRLPVFARSFAADLARVPSSVARAAMARIGRIAAGDASVFRDARHLRADRDLMRLRVGIEYRLIFRLAQGEVEVLTLVPRRDLERAVKSLARGKPTAH